MLFKNKRNKGIVDVMEFSGRHVSTGQVCRYIKKLYDEEGFSYIGYETKNKGGLVRFVIQTIPSNIAVIQYFADRCPGMVEEECKQIDISEYARLPEFITSGGFRYMSK